MLNRVREAFGMLTCWVYASLILGNTKEGDVKSTRRKNLEFGLTQMSLLCREAEGLLSQLKRQANTCLCE
jgi:hypothetical protein